MKYKILIAIVIISLFLLAGCGKDILREKLEPGFETDLAKVIVDNEYTAHYETGYSSSGGTRGANYNYTIKNKVFVSCEGESFSLSTTGENSKTLCDVEKLNNRTKYKYALIVEDLILNLDRSNITNIKNKDIDQIKCFYDIKLDSQNVVVCFEDNHIVNYIAKGGYGGAYTYWNIVGYEFTDEIHSLI